MTYLMTTTSPGDLDTFRLICQRVDPHTTGLIARYAGMNDRGLLAITSVWESKAACDRFTVEHLLPALATVFGPDIPPPGETGQLVEFDCVDELHPGRP